MVDPSGSGGKYLNIKAGAWKGSLPDACRSCSALVAVVLVLTVLVLVVLTVVVLLVIVLVVLVLAIVVLVVVLRHESHLLSCVRCVFCAGDEGSMREMQKKLRKNLQKSIDMADFC